MSFSGDCKYSSIGGIATSSRSGLSLASCLFIAESKVSNSAET